MDLFRCRFGTFGYMAEYGAEKKVSKYSSVVASVSVGQPTGVIMKLKLAFNSILCTIQIMLNTQTDNYNLNFLSFIRLIRSTQSYIFPIHLSEDIIPAAVFYATVTPLVAWFVIKKVIIEPMNAEQKQRDIDRIKETNKKR